MRVLSAQSIQACRISTTDACRTSCQVLVRTVKAIGAGRPLRTWYSSCAATGRSGAAVLAASCPPLHAGSCAAPLSTAAPRGRTRLLCS